MKKIALFCLFGVTAGAVMAEDIVEQDNQEQVVAEKNPFDGFYVGAGVGGSFLQNKSNGVMKKQNVNRFTGNILIGYGRILRERFYLGLELSGEFTGEKTRDVEYLDNYKNNVIKPQLDKKVKEDKGDSVTISSWDVHAKVKNKAFTPELTLKIGYVTGNNMFYAKTGIARPEAKATFKAEVTLSDATKASIDSNLSTSKIVPVVYLGVARAFGSKWSSNIEAGYQFEQKVNDDKVNGGWKVRAGVAYIFDF